MFTHQLNSDSELFCVSFTNFAKEHYLKDFIKKNKTQSTNQIDELKYKSSCWLAKYDFRIACTKQSTKDSGNRAILFVDNNNKTIKILVIYNKKDLPKNQKETDYIFKVLNSEYLEIMKMF